MENLTITQNRYQNICNARNKLLNFYKDNNKNKDYSNNKWIILLDTNIIFNLQSIKELINNSLDGTMIISNTKYYSDEENINNKYYYDLLALDYGKNFKKKQVSFDTNPDNIIKVESGFGGLVLIDRDYLINNNWNLIKPNKVNNIFCSNIICEHWEFCYNLNEKNKKIYLIKNSRSLWFLDKYINNNKKKKNFYNFINKDL